MPLAAVLENLEGKPDYYKDIYVEVDGKWVLDGDIENHPKATNLKLTLDKERKTKRDLEKEREKFAGVDLERWSKLKDLEDEELTAFHTWREEKEKSNGETTKAPLTDEEFNKRAERLTKKWEAREAALLRENTDLKTSVDKTTALLHERTIKTELLNACTKSGMYPNAVEEAVMLGQMVFRLNGEGEVVAVDKDGNEMIGADLKPLRPEEWIASKMDTKAHWWPRSSGGGAGGGSGGNGYGKIAKKSDFHGDPEAQSAFIKKFGREAYLNLPA